MMNAPRTPCFLIPPLARSGNQDVYCISLCQHTIGSYVNYNIYILECSSMESIMITITQEAISNTIAVTVSANPPQLQHRSGFKILPVSLSKHPTRADVAGTVNTFLGNSQLQLKLS